MNPDVLMIFGVGMIVGVIHVLIVILLRDTKETKTQVEVLCSQCRTNVALYVEVGRVSRRIYAYLCEECVHNADSELTEIGRLERVSIKT